MTETIAPHGGKLTTRELQGREAEEARKKAAGLKKITLAPHEVSDLEMIAAGALSPLEGFMGKADVDSVLKKMHLAGGLAWSLPVVKSLTDEEKKSLKAGDDRVRVAVANGDDFAVIVRRDAAHVVVNGRHHGDRLTGQIDAGDGHRRLGDSGQPLGQDLRVDMVEVKEDVILMLADAAAFADFHRHRA